MSFPTSTFLLLCVAVVAAHVATRTRPPWWKASQLVASVVFLAWADVWLVPMYAAAVLWVWWWCPRLAGAPKWRLRVFTATLVVALAVSRYTLFALDLADAAGIDGWRPDSWWTPISISFITFQAIMIGSDRRRGTLKQNPGIVDVALILALFPKAVAGPLVRPAEFLEQLSRWPRPVYPTEQIIALMLAGLTKKVLLAGILFDYEAATARPELLSGSEAALRMVVGPMRVLCDVSAYTDLALAAAMLIGVSLPENFRKPLRASSVSDYWRRWHMTVSRFFGEHIFEPLRGTKTAGRARVAAAAVATMAISGLWHGAAVSFLIWGVLHGIVLAGEGVWRISAADRRLERRRQGERVVKSKPSPARKAGQIAATYAFLSVSGVFFTNVSPAFAWQRITSVTNPWTGFTHLNAAVVLAIVAVIASQVISAATGAKLTTTFGRAPIGVQVACAALVVTVIYGLSGGGVPAFLYFGI